MMVRRALTPEARDRGRRLGTLLRRARGDRSITDIATAAGVSPETLRKIETGRLATPSFAIVAAVATILDLSLDAVAAEVTAADAAPADMPTAVPSA